MAVIKYRGIVLKETLTGEANKQLVVLAKGAGKVFLSAKGAKKPNSKYLAATQLFAYSDFIAFSGGGFHAVTQAELLESFYPLRTDLVKLSTCAFFAELLEKTVFEEMESDDVLRLLLHTFSLLSNRPYDPKQAACVFVLRYLKLSGLMPVLSACAGCGCEVQGAMLFSPQAGGVVCEHCMERLSDCIQMPAGVYQAFCYILSEGMKKAFQFSVSKEVLNQLWLTVLRYMQVHINERFYTLDFLLGI